MHIHLQVLHASYLRMKPDTEGMLKCQTRDNYKFRSSEGEPKYDIPLACHLKMTYMYKRLGEVYHISRIIFEFLACALRF